MASWVVGIWVSPTSFRISNICWPQQPPTKKVLNFNMIFHDSIKSIFFKNIKIKLNSRIWMTEVLSSNFPLCMPQQPPWSHWPFQPHFIKKSLILMVGSSLAPKWPMMLLFLEWIIKNPIFHWYQHHFCWRLLRLDDDAFFLNWLIKLKCPLDTLI